MGPEIQVIVLRTLSGHQPMWDVSEASAIIARSLRLLWRLRRHKGEGIRTPDPRLAKADRGVSAKPMEYGVLTFEADFSG